MEINETKLSKYVDDFLIDNINSICIDIDTDLLHINEMTNDKYFPNINNINFENLLIDEVGKFSITLPKKADVISKIIKNYCNDDKNITITDATAGVGGNVISFCKFGFKVNAVEINLTRFDYLKNNINEYKFNESVNFFNENYIDIYDKIQQDIIYIDPPWGGINYKDLENISLYINDITIEDICISIIEKKLAKLTVIKLPFNYNLNIIKNKITNSFIVYKMKHILLIIIFNL
jgi:16S rRNA G966 N2-methylase RsmD